MNGWGAVRPSAGTHALGNWSPIDKQQHINFLELKAVLLGLNYLCHLLSDQHFQLHIDSMTAVNYIKKLRGHALLHAMQSLREFRNGLTTGTFGSLLLTVQEKTMLWPDSNAWKIDAFSSSWAHLYVYAFAPFAILKRALRTLEEDQATAILIAPCWPTACWFLRLLCLLTAHPLQLPIHPHLLQHPQLPHLSHPSVKP